jgi:hypothetical protein
MKHLIRLFVSFLVPAFMLAGVAASPAMAQDKAKDAKAASAAKAEKGKAVQKVLLENDKVRVFEVTFKPGDEGAKVARPYRIIRTLKGGTLQRTYADGKTEKIEWKTGAVREVGPDPVFTPKNVGKTDVVLYVVNIKGVK